MRFCLSVPVLPEQRRARSSPTAKTTEDANDQAYGVQVQDRPPDGREHLGSSEKPGEPAGIRPRPTWPAPQEQTLRLRRAAQGQAEVARILRQYLRAAVPRHLSGGTAPEGR